MADAEDIDLESGGDPAGEADASSKKTSGLAGLLPTILKFGAIGLGALIFIVTVAVITFNILNNRGDSQTVISETSPYIGARPQYSTFALIGQVSTRTRDQAHTVVVDMIIGYPLNDNASQTELIARVVELQDFTRNYFSGKYAEELQPENEPRLKQEIRELLNTRYLEIAKVREIYFKKFDLMEM
ncbi:flagellar basal body protein FliL [Spirochaetia bacterium]|nr:flagellar basal body protein FliL [Spirochaetia bacterium]